MLALLLMCFGLPATSQLFELSAPVQAEKLVNQTQNLRGTASVVPPFTPAPDMGGNVRSRRLKGVMLVPPKTGGSDGVIKDTLKTTMTLGSATLYSDTKRIQQGLDGSIASVEDSNEEGFPKLAPLF